ncbi:Nn.00g115060.m01.CDS01 [Neocucurbitaria sp. VM-36]
MQSEPTNVSKHVSTPQNASDIQATSQHGQHRDDDLQASLQPHSGGPQGESEPPTGGNGRDATRPESASDHADTAEAVGLKGIATAVSPPRNRIAEYENALAVSPPKPSEGRLFEVTKSNRKPDDKSSPIAKLPNEVLIHAIAHLSPNDLAAVALVSRRFNDVVTTPHAWQVAFARYFPGPQSLEDAAFRSALENNGTIVRSEKRRFTRLTALASWRSEYILRTRLLRSLARGKPVQISSTPSRAGHSQPSLPVPTITYDVRTYTIINHLHGTFGSGLNKRMPRFVHGADDVGMVTSSDPATGKVDPWGQSDPNFYSQFSERFPGVAEWGLGSGDVVGCPNVMDVSQPYGMIYGQGCPEGSCYYRSLEEMRGRFVAEPTEFTMPEAGIPKLGIDGGAICSVWIAKSNTIPSLSEGLIGMMMGSAAGIVTACSIGTDGLRASRVQRGELTARWVLSPGVPIIAIAIDENYSLKRHAQNRIWAVALNALGELFYLTKFPTRSQASKGSIEEYTEYLAWLTGRSVYWNLVEPSRRTARPDPYGDAEFDGSYSPRTSWDGMCLSKEQVIAETLEMQQFLRKPPKHFRKSCLGWDMRRRLEVDFAGDDGNYAGEAMVVFECGLEEGDVANVTRFTRWKTNERDKSTTTSTRISTPQPSQTTSLFGGAGAGTPDTARVPTRARSSSYMSTASSPERASLVEEWRCSKLTFGGFKNTQLVTTTLDISTFATLTLSEDPALGFSTASTASSPYASPMSVASQPAFPSDIPGQRARFVAAGTKTGVVLLWDIRSPVSRSSEYSNNIDPVRIIYTESPEISCLAMTSLHLVVGGNDGLVQAWDPLASSMSPIRTLNSRHSSRARRRLVQAQASVQGVGINMFAAGAVCLDPDPTVLRGAVSLGNQLRYWSYSSSAADQYKSSKRRLRRSERGSNNAGERFSGTGRANLKDYIANEKYEMEREKQERRKMADRLAGRFGTELLSEEEALAYAAMLSQESMEAEEKRRRESESSALSSETVTPEPSVFGQSSPTLNDDQDLDADIAEAIRLSLNGEPTSGISEPSSTPPSTFDIPIKYAKGKKSSPSRSNNSPSNKGKATAGSSKQSELSDLEFAMQLSLAEEVSRKEAEDAFPPLSPAGGKGKGKMW